MKKTVLTLCAAILLGFASAAPAADQMNVSDDTLASMGLGGMQQMSDDAGMTVRGKGFASVFGFGLARLFTSPSIDTYNSTSGPRNGALAGGLHGSVSITGGILPFLGGGFLGSGSFGGAVAFGR